MKHITREDGTVGVEWVILTASLCVLGLSLAVVVHERIENGGGAGLAENPPITGVMPPDAR